MDHDSLIARFREMQDYLGWTEEDARAIQSIAADLEWDFAAIVADFYAEIDRHPDARKVITGGDAQLQRLRTTLLRWFEDLVSGRYDDQYVKRRWQVGLRHAEIGLDQIYCNVAMGRIRGGFLDAVSRVKNRDPAELQAAARALNKLLDLDLAIIEDAYQCERLARQKKIERLATLGQIAGGVAHELRNPLSVVKTSVYYLMHAKAPNAEKTAEHLRRIERHVELADGVISALSSFARMPVPEAKPFSIDKCLLEVLEQTALPESIAISLVGLHDLPLVSADASQIRIVLSNLVRNAAEAMAGSGRLTIKGKLDGGKVEIALTDTGPGIPADQLPRIMEPFFTTKARGLGLGLAICRSIADKNQGELRVDSRLGEGSTFSVCLSAAPPRPQGDPEP
jgi:signal transduction histidine kinase